MNSSKPTLRLAATLLALAATAAAANLKGTVTNGTTGKPAAGDDVVLLKLAQGMEEAARTRSDAKGNFSFTIDDGAPYLVRAIHQSVTYHKQVPPGTSTADVTVYDAAPKLEGIAATVQVMRFQASKDTLQVSELYAVKNTSTPPRTLMGDQTFEIELPPGALIDGAIALSGKGMPVNSAPVPSDKQKGRYFFVFPLRPGETRFEVSYHLPYTGEASFQPKALYPLEHFVVVVPKSMQFTAGNGGSFQPMPDESGVVAQVATNVKPGESVAFKVAGTGDFPREAQGGNGGDEAAAAGSADTRPGGGLGPPSEAPDPLRQYRWYILGGLAVAMVAGAVYVLKRPREPHPIAAHVAAGPPRNGSRTAAVAAGRTSLLMEALKEELFQLEVEKQEGHLSPQEYDKAKAALDVVIGRALRRANPAPRVEPS